MKIYAIASYIRFLFKFHCVKKILKLLLMAVAIYFVSISVSYESVRKEILNVNLFLATLALTLLLGRVSIMAWRWQILLNIKGYQCPLGKLSEYYFIGFFFNNFLPTSMGGDLTRGISLARQKIPKKIIISTILLERFLGVTALLLIGLVSYLICWNNKGIQNDVLEIAGIFLGISCLGGLTLLFVPLYARAYFSRLRPSWRIVKKIISIFNHFAEYWVKPFKVLLALILTVLCQVSGIVSIYIVSISIHQHTPFVYFSFLLPIIWLASMLPLSFGGLGVREGSFLFLFGLIGMNSHAALSISLIWLVFSYIQGLAGGFLYIMARSNENIS